MNETLITLQGYVGGDVRLRPAGESQVATFRVGSTPRHYSRKTESWVDGATQWYTVNCWRSLGEHVDRSLRRGDPVVVHGRLSIHSWVNKEGVEVNDFEVDALFVGHDLNRGITMFAKASRPAPPSSDEESTATEEPFAA